MLYSENFADQTCLIALRPAYVYETNVESGDVIWPRMFVDVVFEFSEAIRYQADAFNRAARWEEDCLWVQRLFVDGLRSPHVVARWAAVSLVALILQKRGVAEIPNHENDKEAQLCRLRPFS